MGGWNRARRALCGLVALSTTAVVAFAVAPVATPVAQAAIRTLTVVATNVDEGGTTPGTCAGPPLGNLGTCTLQAAMEDAGALMLGGDDVVIQFAPALGGQTFQPGSGLGTANPALYHTDVPLGRSLTIDGPANRPTLNGNSQNRIFDIQGSGSVTIRNLILSFGNATSAPGLSGGSIRNSANLRLENVRLVGSTATTDAGGVLSSGSLTVVGSEFVSSQSSGSGGAIYVNGAGATVSVTGSRFDGNLAQRGAAVRCDCAGIIVSGTTFTDNISNVEGAALSTQTVTATIDVDTSTFANNDATSAFGGAITCECASLAVDSSSFAGNDAGAFGGAIYTEATTNSISATTFTINTANAPGGAIRCQCAAIDITGATFTLNQAVSGGGAFASLTGSAPVVTVRDTFFDRSSAGGDGGAMLCDGCTLVDVAGSVFAQNVAAGSGGALWSNADTVFHGNNVRDGNGQKGGGLYLTAGADLDLADSYIAGNASLANAPNGLGGGLACDPCNAVSIVRTTFQDDVANDVGGGAGIRASGNVSMEAVTFAGNAANTDGEGLSLTGVGVGVADLENVTIANHANEGAAVSALYVDPTSPMALTMNNSIVADNEVNCSLPGGFAITGTQANIVEAGGCNTLVPSVQADPGLLPINFQGGPGRAGPFPIPVFAFLGTSVANNFGTCAIGSTDARGEVRDPAACDAGAFELGLTVTAENGVAPQIEVPSIVPLAAVSPQGSALATASTGDGQAFAEATVRDVSLTQSPLRNVPLRNVGLDDIGLTNDVLDSISLAQVGLVDGSDRTWTEFLTDAGLPALAALPANTVTLLDLLTALPATSSLSLDQLDLSNTPLGSLPMGALALANVTLDSIGFATATDWCATYVEPFTDTPCSTTPGTDPNTIYTDTATLVTLALEGIPLRNVPLRNVPLRNVDLTDAPLRNVPLRNVDLTVSPLRNVPLRNVPLRNVDLVWAPLRNVPLRNVDISASPLRNVPLRNVALTNSPLRNVPLRNVPLRNVDIDASPLRNVPLRNVDLSVSPLRNVPLRNVPLRNVPLRNVGGLAASPLRNVPLRNVSMVTSPLRNVPLRNVSTFEQLVDCNVVDCASTTITLGQVTFLPSATLGLVADGLADSVDLSVLGTLGDITFEATDTFVLADIAEAIFAPGADTYTLESLFTALVADTAGTFTLGDIAAALGLPIPGVDDTATGEDLILPLITLAYLVDVVLANPAAYGLSATEVAQMQQDLDNLEIGALLAALAQIEPPVTLDELFLGLLLPKDYPWEAIDLQQVGAGIADAAMPGGIPFVVRVNGTLPSTRIDLAVTLPAGFTYVPDSLGLMAGATLLAPPVLDSPGPDQPSVLTAQISMPDLPPTGGVIGFNALPPLELGDSDPIVAEVTAPAWSIAANTADGYLISDPLEPNDTSAQALDLGPAVDTVIASYMTPADPADWFAVDITQGQELSLLLSNLPADYDMLLFAPVSASPSLRGAATRVLVPAADNGLSLLGKDAVVAQIAADVDTAPPTGYRMLEGSARRSTDDERIDTTPLAAGRYLVRITSYNGASSPRPYLLRLRVAGSVAAQQCAAIAAPGAALPLTGVASPTDANTLVLVDTARLARSYPNGAASVISELASFTTALAGAPAARFAGTKARVIDLATVTPVRLANANWDAQPCDPERANAVVAEIGDVIDQAIAATPTIEHVVIVGADDQVPMARLRDNTPAHNEQEYTETWSAASPLAAAQALGYLMSDDPYGTSRPFAVGARDLFVPEVGVGRLVETPGDIVTALSNFVAFDGLLDPQSAVSTGYDFLEDGAQRVADELTGAVVPTVDRSLISTGLDAWTKQQLVAAVANAGPDVVSVNAHFDHYRALPADQDAAGRLTDPVTTSDVTGAPAQNGERPLRRSIIFSMGCHSGLSVSDISIGLPDAALKSDWAQTFGGEGAAAFAGNTGYGYGDTDVVAFSEELMRLFAERLSQAPTVGAAMSAAKQRYISDLAVVSPFEEKVTSQVVFYGLPMYRVDRVTPPTLEPFEVVSPDPVSGQPSATVSVIRTAIASPATNGTVYAVDGEVQATAYQPVQPRTSVDVTAEGTQARGALITSLTSRDDAVIDPVIVTPTDDVTGANTEAPFTDGVFPSALQTVARVDDVGGERDRLVLVPGQFRSITGDPGGQGVQRLFTSIGARVFYAPAGNTDTTPARIVGTDAVVLGGRVAVDVEVGDPDVTRVLVLYTESNAADPKVWKSLELGSTDGLHWLATGPVASGATVVDYFVQVLDSGGNVSVSADKGTNFVATTAPVVTPGPGDPTIGLSPAAPNAGAVYTGTVVVTATSGAPGQTVTLLVNGVPSPSPTTLTVTGVYEITVVADGHQPITKTIVLDNAAPTVSASVSPAPNPTSGWHTATPVTVTITGTPAARPIAHVDYTVNNGSSTRVSSASATVSLTTDGVYDVAYTATDTAGNQSSAGQVTVRIDTAPPTITCASTPTFTLNQTGATVSATVAGAVSDGPITLTATTSAVGTFQATGPAVVDEAGNTVTPSCPYRVVYVKTGFFEPITMGVVNNAQAGRTIPVKWRLVDATGAPVSDTSSFVRLAISPLTCAVGPSDDIEQYLTVATSSLQYLGNGNWQYNWKTDKALAGQCRTIAVQLKDGTAITASFKFR